MFEREFSCQGTPVRLRGDSPTLVGAGEIQVHAPEGQIGHIVFNEQYWPEIAFVDDLEIAEGRRGRGLGACVYRHLEAEIRAAGVRQVAILPTRKAAGFWRAMGFPTSPDEWVGDETVYKSI